MQDVQVNTFNGGLDFDSDLRVVKTDRYVDALNVETMSVDKSGLNAINPMQSSALAFSIPSISDIAQFTKLRYQDNVDITFYFYSETGAVLGQGFIYAVDNTSFAAFETAFTAAMLSYGYDVADFQQSGDGDYFLSSVESGAAPVRISFLWQVDGEYYEEIVVQEAYTSGTLRPIATWNVEDRLFVFSSTGNSNAIEIGIATKGTTWSYTRILRTWRFLLPTTEAIDIRVEKVSNQSWALYWTDNTNKPKVLYIPEVYTQDCVAKYNTTDWDIPTSGYIIYNEASEQTNLQLINNAGLVTYSDQLQNGGALLSGGYRYSVRFGINGTENTTEWSVLTPNVIPVYRTSTTSPSAYIRIQGDKSGTATSKVNVLLVQNALPNIYNFVELACIYSAGKATSAYIVGRFDVTDSEFTVTHTGAETGTIAFDAGLLAQTEPVVLKAKSLEIKKNRLNLANLEIGADDPALAAIASAATITQGKYAMTGVGSINAGGDGAVVVKSTGVAANCPWNPSSSVYQYAENAPLTFKNIVVDTFNKYNSTTGFWAVPFTGTYRITAGIGYSGGATNLPRQPIFNWILNVGAVQVASGNMTATTNFDVTFTATAGQSVYIGVTYEFSLTNLLFIGVDGGFTISAVTIDSPDFNSTKVGEYQLPENCATKVGYMLSEKYAFFMRAHYKNGYISAPFFIGYFDNQWNGTDKSLFTSSTGESTYETYSYYAKIGGLNVSSIKDQINGISIWRAECNPTILGSGVIMPADNLSAGYYNAGYYASIPTTSGAYATAYGALADQRYFSMFFSHDTRVNKTQPNAGDTLRYFDSPKVLKNVSGMASPNGSQFGSFAEYYGEIQTAADFDVVITDGRYTDFDEATGVPNSSIAAIRNAVFKYIPNINVSTATSGSMENISLATSNRITVASAATDNGLYIAQYIRTIAGEQYDLLSVNIVPTGTYINVNEMATGILPFIDVFGGDTYTQKNILKVRYWSTYDSSSVRASFITYYGQQKINTQMLYNDFTVDKTTFNLQGHQSVTNYLFPFAAIEDVVEEQFNYDEGFSSKYPLLATAYNSKLPSESKFISRIHYSQQKPINSLQDFYRKIGAFDFRDLDTKNGAIAAIRDVNNYMVSIQPRAVSVLPYLSDVAIGTQGGGEVLIGTGGVYNQRENIISTYGTGLQTCTLVGNNNNGNSTLYWFSPEFNKYCRYGGDGIKILSDDNGMRSFFLTMQAVAEYDMIQTFDIEHASVIMTWGGTQNKTLLFNEKSNNFSTFASFIPLRYFPYQNIVLAPRISATDYNQIYELFGGTGVLNYLGIAPSIFMIEYVVNKGGMSDKRFLSTALSVGDGYSFTNPTVAMSVNGDSVFPHTITTFEKRFENWFGAFNKSAGQQPIGQCAVVRVESTAYIILLGAVTKFRNIFRSLFK